MRGVTSAAVSPRAFAALLVLAVMFSGNHVAARVAMDHGVDVITAVAARSLSTAAVVGLLVALRHRAGWRQPALTARQRRTMAALGLLVAVQSACLYAAVARLPVGLALLVFNTFPLWAAFAAWALYRSRPERAVLLAMPLILAGLALALDVTGLASGLDLRTRWAALGTGVGFALAAAATFGLVLALTQHEVAALDGRWRSFVTMSIVGVLALAVALAGTGLHWPSAPAGWWGLVLLSLLYGSAFTMVFTLLPRLGAVGNSPILNVEPVAALLLGWVLLGQAVAPVQWAGALLVVGVVMALGLRRR